MKPETRNAIKALVSMARIMYPQHHPYLFIVYMYLLYCKAIKRKIKYNIVKTTNKLIKNELDHQHFDDINNTVIVNENNLCTGDNMLLLYCDKTKCSHPVYVLPRKYCRTNEILIGQTLWENIGKMGFTSMALLLNYHQSKVEFATRAEVCMINSPDNISLHVCNELLKSYFKTPKIVRRNFLIEIDVKHFAEDMFLTNTSVNCVEKLYFKVTMVVHNKKPTEGFYFCSVAKTSLSQTANMQNFIPKNCFKNIYNDGNRLVITPSCPYGLKTYLDSMLASVRPFMEKRKLKLNPVFLVQGPQGSGKEVLVRALAEQLGMHFYKVNSIDLTANVYAQNETKLHNVFFTAKNSAPCLLSIHNFESFGINNDGDYDERLMGNFQREISYLFDNNSFPLLLFCCTTKMLPFELKKTFLETFQINAPNDKERELILEWILKEQNVESNVSLTDISSKTHGFFFEDLKALIFYAVKDFKINKIHSQILLEEENISKAFDIIQNYYKDNIGAPKVPKVLWSDIGGLEDVKKEIIQTISLPLKHPEFLKKSGLKRSGILLFGPPGTGKTLIAKAVATECSLCFLSVKGPELLNMYVGQSEQNIREVFQRAREASPCIIFFDEIDSLAPNRGMSGDSGGVMNRIVSQLLAEMDGLNESATVFIIAATNRPDLIDPSLLRPGRFDKLLYVSPCTNAESKTAVLKALTRKFTLQDNIDLREVINICPSNITGADFYGISSVAWNSAVRKLVQKIQTGEIDANSITEKDVIVSFEDFENAIKNVKPSVSVQEMENYEKLRVQLGSNA